jgi:FkbM family methyltransferase
LQPDATKEPLKLPEWASTCTSVYLDLGSNIGVNVRKLYEAEKYPGAKLSPLFDKHFGDVNARRQDAGLCVFGFEPNPEHRARLQQLQHAYKDHGWKVHFYPSAAWRSNGFMALNMSSQRGTNEGDTTDLGAHLSMKSQAYPGAKEIMVKTADMAAFIKALPVGSVKLLSMDIEGAEYEVLARLMQESVMCESLVKSAVVEAHEWGEISNWGDARTFAASTHPRSFKGIEQRLAQLKDFDWCKPSQVSEVQSLDDETYAADVDDRFGDLSEPAMSAARAMQAAAVHAKANSRAVTHDFQHPDWLQNCKSIYVDVGSNVGVSVRKLFEPERYPSALLRDRFSKFFGDARAEPFEKTGLCALALEPDPEHFAQLDQLQQDYFNKGWRVHFYPFAAWSSDGYMLFNTTSSRAPRPEDTTHTGSHLQQHFPTWPGARESSVRTIDFSRFLQSLPQNSVKFMTMDIEGAEYETLAHLFQKNALCDSWVQHLAVETHGWGQISNWGAASTFTAGHPRSFAAVKERASQVQDWCKPGKQSEIELFADHTYTSDSKHAY